MEIQYNTQRLLAAVDRFPDLKVLVVGDVMLDEFIWGTVDRISPEAPVPVVNVTEETRLLGGAANVINNIVSAGGKPGLAGIVGDDPGGQEIVRMLDELGVETKGIIVDSARPTTLKTRVVAHAQQVVRFDRERRLGINGGVLEKVFNYLRDQVGQVNAVIISDYGKGLITGEMMDEIRRLYRREGMILAVDPKVQNFGLYRRATVITPNHHEAALGSGVVIDSEETLVQAGNKIIDDLDCESVVITRGEKGMALFEKSKSPQYIPTVAREVFDVTGAGDTVIAILTLGRAAGLSRWESAVLANFAAGVVVGEVGTSAVTAEGLKAVVKQGAPAC